MHGLEVHLDRGALKDSKVNTRASLLVHARGADDTDGGVVNREVPVLLEGLAEGV